MNVTAHVIGVHANGRPIAQRRRAKQDQVIVWGYGGTFKRLPVR